MPVYTYRREDGTTFDVRQKFLDEALQVCPSSGQAVSRVIQPAGIIFKGSGFYVNDNNKANNSANPTADNGDAKPEKTSDKPEAKPEKESESKSEKKTESRTTVAAGK
jgi:putative FmdB family regulatory protein